MMNLATVGLKRLTLLLTAGALVAVVIVFDPLAPLLDNDEAATVAPPRAQTEITLTSLSRTVEVEGQLVPAEQRTVVSLATGSFTSIAAVGGEIVPSTVLFAVDEEPTVALIGDLPMWRTITVDDVGPDVAQLEANLVAMGYDTEGELTVDDTYTTFTSAVVERWQEDLGLSPTGTVSEDLVVFVPDNARVTSTSATVGQATPGAAGGSPVPVLTASSRDRKLVFTVQAEDLDTIALGTEVTARLPDRSTVTALVTELGAAGDGSWSATAILSSPAGETDLPEGEAVPVTVSWTEIIVEDALTVQANALTRLDTGSYVLEVIEDDGSTRLVEVGLGAQSGSTVEVITELEPRTQVIAP